jgi:hypothetical protein
VALKCEDFASDIGKRELVGNGVCMNGARDAMKEANGAGDVRRENRG